MRHSILWSVLSLCVVLATPAFSQDLTCPSGTTPVEVDAWRALAAAALDSGSATDQQVAAKLKECFGGTVPQCLKRVNDYALRNVVASTNQDPKVGDTPQKQPPAELKSSTGAGLEYVFPENIEALAAEKGWPAVRYKSRHAGGFDAETPSLLMVYVPGDKVNPPVSYDRWLNFALPADTGAAALTPRPAAPVPNASDYAAEASGGPQLPRTFTMVTLERKTETNPGKVYFQKFFRGGQGNPVFKPESNSAVAGCISCHPNGLRAISPLGFHVRDGEEQLPEVDWRAVELINDSMNLAAGNKSVSWRDVVVDAAGATKPLINPKAQGPFVGPVKPLTGGMTRTKEFIMGGTLANGTTVQGCFKRRTTIDVTDIFGRAPGENNIYTLSSTTTPNVNWEKVATGMKCATCHNDNGRGAINDLTAWDQIDFKILVDQSMPLGTHQNPLDQGSPTDPVVDGLTEDERIALTNCLQAEFELEQKQLVKWLTQTTCQ